MCLEDDRELLSNWYLCYLQLFSSSCFDLFVQFHCVVISIDACLCALRSQTEYSNQGLDMKDHKTIKKKLKIAWKNLLVHIYFQNNINGMSRSFVNNPSDSKKSITNKQTYSRQCLAEHVLCWQPMLSHFPVWFVTCDPVIAQYL